MIEFCLAVLLTGLAIVGFGFNVYIVLALLVAGQVSRCPAPLAPVIQCKFDKSGKSTLLSHRFRA